LNKNPDSPLKEIITLLNRETYCSGVFNDQDFFTSVDIAIDHRTLDMEYVSAGHPCFFLIRDNEISGLPEHGREGRNLPIPVMSDMRYSSATCRLKAGDKLILYSDGLNDLPMMKQGASMTYAMLKSLLEDIVYPRPSIPVSELIRVLFSAVSRKSNADSNFVSQANLPDDITIIGLEIEDETRWNERILKPDTMADFNRLIFELYTELFEELQQRNFDISDLGIRSVLSESLVNAWIHGNRKDRNKTITIRWRYGNDFCLAVEDQGQGFDYHRISDPKCEENIAKTSGRGIYIIRRFSDAVRWENRGRCIIITIKRCRNNGCMIK
jgi:anti-sigma regulatory factor (Ser/Thr protein kinase)